MTSVMNCDTRPWTTTVRSSLLVFLLASTLLSVGCKRDSAPESDGDGWGASGSASAPDATAADKAPGTPVTAAEGGSSAAEGSGSSEATKAEAGLNRFAPGGEVPDSEIGQYYVSMTCEIEGEDIGTMTFDLWTEAAPITTRNFLRLCDEGWYDGIAFHRIMREFMAQGGDPTGTGGGNGPHGMIKAEFSEDPSRAHGYGVLSMARQGGRPDSASAQFFLCCDESPSVWSLDGQYASFGRMSSGVETLEKIATVPVRSNARGEPSTPTKTVKITSASVHKGAAPTGEVIERPAAVLDLGGEPERVLVQHVLIAFKGAQSADAKTMRTKEEAEELARNIKEQIEGGADMTQYVLSASGDPVQEGDPTPGYYMLLNNGVRDPKGDRMMHDLGKRQKAAQMAASERMRAGEITRQQMNEEVAVVNRGLQAEIPDNNPMPRARMMPAFGDMGFKLGVGEVEVVPYHARNSPYGFHVIKRIQ